MSRWFRHYAGMMRDDKLVRVALRAKQPIERVVWVWGAMLESAAEINDNGRYDVDAAEVAYFLRSDEADILAVLAALTDAGRVAEGCVVNWGARQFESDRSASRQAAYRERKRAVESDRNAKPPSCDGGVTATLRHSDAPETETETETEKKIDDGGDARASPEPMVSAEAVAVAEQVAELAGIGKPLDWPPGWCGAPMRVQAWLAQGWTTETIMAAVRGAMARKRDGPPGSIQYFEKPIAKLIAQQSAPLPNVVQLPAQTVEIPHERQLQSSSIVAAGRRRLAELAELARGGFLDGPGGAAGEGGAGDAAGNPDVRLLPPR